MIFLLTPEYPSSLPTGGGLASFLARLARALHDCGREVTVVSLAADNGTHWDGFVRVEHVARWTFPPAPLPGLLRGWLRPCELLVNAWRLRARLATLAKAAAVEFVHVSDYQAVGLCLGRNWRGAPVVLRCSWVRRDYTAMDGNLTRPGEQLSAWLEEWTVRRAELVYAPCDETRRRYESATGRAIRILRPPVPSPVSAPAPAAGGVVLHFAGVLRPRKGSDLAAQAIVRAHAMDSSIQGTLIGQAQQSEIKEWCGASDLAAAGLTWQNSLPRAEMQKLLAGASCVILPSRLDNLPNTALEALSLGIPVISTRGSSIDEVVRDGVDGYIVDPEDVQALAERVVDIWQQRGPVRRRVAWNHPLRPEMYPENAVALLIRAVRENRGIRDDG
jgi:glycosyltransferase involved in cell wall biosynthesis